MTGLNQSAFCDTCKHTTVVEGDVPQCSVCHKTSTNRVTDAIYRIKFGGCYTECLSWVDVVTRFMQDHVVRDAVEKGAPITISMKPGIVDLEVGSYD